MLQGFMIKLQASKRVRRREVFAAAKRTQEANQQHRERRLAAQAKRQADREQRDKAVREAAWNQMGYTPSLSSKPYEKFSSPSIILLSNILCLQVAEAPNLRGVGQAGGRGGHGASERYPGDGFPGAGHSSALFGEARGQTGRGTNPKLHINRTSLTMALHLICRRGAISLRPSSKAWLKRSMHRTSPTRSGVSRS